MKVLLINKFHFLKGGAERSYFDTADILAERGHDLAFFSMKHPENRPSRWERYFVSQVDYNVGGFNILRKIRAILDIWYNREAKRKLERLIKDFKPEVAHLHGIYHQISPSILDVLEKYNIPVVMTLHDYKLVSPAYNLSVRGRIWEKDKGGKLYNCILDRVVKNSILKSLVCVIEAYLHKRWNIYDKIDLFISPSDFLMDKFREYGFKGRMVKLPNPVIVDAAEKGIEDDHILYYGRLSQEKGVSDLIKAFSRLKTDVKLKIAGDGPEMNRLVSLSQDLGLDDRVEFLGFKDIKELAAHIAGSRFVVVPSRCYENAPYSILEAMAFGKAVIASRLGGIKDMVKEGENGLLYEPGDISGLKNRLEELLGNKELAAALGSRGRQTVKVRNCKDCYYYPLLKIYEQLIDKKQI